ncbi:hypothetical protein F5B19DRAFT_484626 [Rostrohypoxylon terebratum]|nr:hypothetical protein F5B19DRAFT_484626 [Rostrohypoxylon terebratum]
MPHRTVEIVSTRLIDAPRPLKVIYIGAGISRIIAAIQFQKPVPSVELVIYEKNHDVGGTWLENRYPGCACDVPSHAYQLSFESWTEWSQFYAGSPEIWQYWNLVANKHNVRRHMRFNHKCIEATWNESKSKWSIKLQKLDEGLSTIVEDEADVFITGTGFLNEWTWPKIEGLPSFKGDLLHTAGWDESCDLSDKRVAVIGSGSSGIQVVPALVNKVKAIDHYVRGRIWIIPQFSDESLRKRTADAGYFNSDYSQEEKDYWKANPAAYLEYRKILDYGFQSLFPLTLPNTPEHKNARIKYEKNMRARLQAKPELIDLLIPDYPPLCKRLTPGPGYLEALVEPHVTVISQSIASVDAEAIITTDGVRHPVDAIVCATGFDTSPGRGFPIYGRGGVNLREKFKDRPETYLGICTDEFPNFFQSLGPNTWQGSGNLIVMIEYAHIYIAKILKRLVEDNIRTVEPKRKNVERFTNFCDEYFKDTVYTADCLSWYKSAPAGSNLHALRALKNVRWEDFEIETDDGNDFGWFGNGRAMADEVPKYKTFENCTWYLSETGFVDETPER